MDWKFITSVYQNSSLFDSADIVKYFGIVLLTALVIYVLFKLYEKKDLILWLPVIFYFLFYCYLFHPNSDIRYLLPIVPLLAVLSSKVIVNYLSKRWLKISLLCICMLQLGATAFHVRTQRQIPKGIKEGFTYLRNETAPDALIMYPEYVLLEAAHRRFVWGSFNVNHNYELKVLFWDKKDDKVRGFLVSKEIDYIAVKKSRIYDDSKAHHIGGYPESFVKRLPSFNFLESVFDNEEMSIWKVNK